MKTRCLWVLAMVLMFATSSAFGGTAMQMWKCGMEDNATEEAIEARATKWLKAARQVDGGEDISVHLLFPVAVNASGETDFMFIVTSPSFSDWGKFWDAYPDSDAAAFEGEGTFCPDSVLWEAISIK